MAGQLPDLDRESFSDRLRAELAAGLPELATLALWEHYRELRRWNPRLSLVGPGTRDTVVERHYGESLQVLDWCPENAQNHIDIGTGGGFPGFVLAAARPQWSTTLIEPRQKKWAFLLAAVRAAQLSCQCLNARVDARLPGGLPEELDVVTIRALRLSESAWRAVSERLSPGGRVLWWVGEESGGLPSCLRLVESRPLARSLVRRVAWLVPR